MEPRSLVGVRLSEEEVRLLERLTTTWGLGTRSEVLRELIKRAGELPPPGRETLELPPMLLASLEEMVEDGWAETLTDALARTVDRGLSVLATEYEERGQRTRDAASALHARRVVRKSAARKGLELLREGE
jgi:hypothetical protein